MNPCWNGGICHNKENDWSCNCTKGFSGKDCRTQAPVTTTQKQLSTTPVTITTDRVEIPDKYIRVLNKGGYTAIMTLEYVLPGFGLVTQRGSITSGQSYAFCKLNGFFLNCLSRYLKFLIFEIRCTRHCEFFK